MSDTTMDPATVLEEAADLLLIRGRCTDGGYGPTGGARCVMGAIHEVTNCLEDSSALPIVAAAERAIGDHLASTGQWCRRGNRLVVMWNDKTEDDFEVIDTLRLVAKDLRGQAVPE